MGQAKPAAAPVVAAKTKLVTEYVLYRREGDKKNPVMSDHDLDVVRQAKINTIADALRNGQARPDLGITQRDCTFPLVGGVPQAMGSTCEETEL